MDCGLKEDILQESLDNNLGQLENMLLVEHLKNCRSCRRKYEEMKILFTEINKIGKNIDIPNELILLRNGMLNNTEDLKSSGAFTLKELINIQELSFNGAFTFLDYILGLEYIDSGIKTISRSFLKANGLLLKRSMKIMMRKVRKCL